MSSIKKYRKKPVVIEAVQYFWSPGSIEPIQKWGCPVEPSGLWDPPENTDLLIPTLEGKMTCREGDWIIKGVAGEFYPCKDSIFRATYEVAE